MKQEQLLIKVLATQLFIKKIINTIFSILLLFEVVIIIRTIWHGLTKYGLKLFFTLLLIIFVLMFFHSVIKSNIKDTEKQLKKKKPKITFLDKIEDELKPKLQGPTPEARDNFHPEDFKKVTK